MTTIKLIYRQCLSRYSLRNIKMSGSVKMNKRRKSQLSEDSGVRKRGRPTGKNRVPLSLEERRARNAQYERERRNEYADAMVELAEAMGSEASVPNSELLATVLTYLQQATGNDNQSVEDIKRQNELLLEQISILEERVNQQASIQEQ